MSMMLKDMPSYLKPRERLKKYGVSVLNNEELLAILLRTGTKKISVKELSLDILKSLEKIEDLNNLTLNSLLNIKGIGEAKAMTIIAALELGKRIYMKQTRKEHLKVKNGLDVYKMFRYLAFLEEQENLVVLLLDNKSRVITSKMIFKGGLNTSVAYPREIFKYALLNNAAGLIVIHNHPSGDPSPKRRLCFYFRRSI